MDDFEEITFPPKLPDGIDLSKNFPGQQDKRDPLTLEYFKTLCDDDGRIVNEYGLKKAVFRGGIVPELRREVWPLLFGLYSFSSTQRERSVQHAEHCAKYKALKRRCENVLRHHEDEKVHSPQYLQCVPQCEPTTPTSPDPELQQQMQCLDIQAQVFAGRCDIDVDNLVTSVRTIDKDVPRTDRTSDYFRGATNVHLRMLRNILVTFAAYQPEVGYAQGMNDIVARFLVVLDSEENAYWCLVHYIEHMKVDFIEDGMLHKLTLVKELLSEMDPDLLAFLDQLYVGDLTFCHRWMLLSFKREFELEDSLKCFEILSSRHLEMSSLEAMKTQEGEKQKGFENLGGKNRMEAVPATSEYSFEVFVCATILMLYRGHFFNCQDTSDVFGFISSLTLQLNLTDILEKSEILFYTYCKKSVLECFQLLELPSPCSESEQYEILSKSSSKSAK